MKLRSILFGIALAVSLSSSAQNATSKEMNQIKRSKEFFYYEVTGDQMEEMKSIANANLVRLINKYLEQEGDDQKKVTVSDLQDVLYLHRNVYDGKVKLLAYVRRDSYVKKEKAVDSVIEDTRVVEVQYIDKTSAVVSLDSSAVDIASSGIIASPKDTIDVSLNKWQRDAIMALCKISDAETLVQKLIDLQNQYKVKRFGTKENCKDENTSYFVVYDVHKKVIALLGPGTEARYDFLSGERKELNAYLKQGMQVIWFQMSK